MRLSDAGGISLARALPATRMQAARLASDARYLRSFLVFLKKQFYPRRRAHKRARLFGRQQSATIPTTQVTMCDRWRLSVSTVGTLIKQRKLSAHEAAIARLSQVNPY